MVWSSRAVLLPLPLLAGCYSYVPVAAHPLPGTYVRAHVAAVGPPSELRGSGPAAVEGELVSWGPDVVVLSVERGYASRVWTPTLRDTLEIRLDRIAAVEEKRFSPERTTLFGIGAAVAGGLVLRYFFSQWAGGSQDRDPGLLDGSENRVFR